MESLCGEGKSYDQIADMPDSYVLADVAIGRELCIGVYTHNDANDKIPTNCDL